MGIGGVFNSDGPYSSCVTSNLLDYDGKPYAEYLQSNYTIKQSSNTPYAYSMPMK
ncbi:MAG: hypothetical protein MJ200_01125 [Mycoplasmoidaceae bacterium]|nr:hypothetical protein [Mycoplasmoidaceae bacterium]